MKNISYRVALGGIVSALCLLCMFLAGIMPALYLLLPMAAGMLMMIIAEEVSKSWAWLTYISVSLLSIFVTADKLLYTKRLRSYNILSPLNKYFFHSLPPISTYWNPIAV